MGLSVKDYDKLRGKLIAAYLVICYKCGAIHAVEDGERKHMAIGAASAKLTGAGWRMMSNHWTCPDCQKGK